MQSKLRKAKFFFRGIYIFIVVVYLLTCLIPFLNPGTFWFIAFLGMCFPLLLLLVLVCMIIFAILRSRWFFLGLLSLLISFQQISAVFAFHPQEDFSIEKNPNSLRILSWNVSSWEEKFRNADSIQNIDVRNSMMDAIQIQNADVLCFQEYFESYALHLFPANIPVFKKMGYNYCYFTPAFKIISGTLQRGLCIFSKYPIVDSSFHKFNDGGNSEGYSFVDIPLNGKTIRIYNSHLQSPRLEESEYKELGEIGGSKTIAGKIKRSYALRYKQAELFKRSIDSSKYPVIVCGDFNDVPNSYSYFTVKSGLQDAFLKKGFGLGKTFKFISPTLRIDYMFAGKQFTIDQFTRLNYTYSDHYPQLMDISFIN